MARLKEYLCVAVLLGGSVLALSGCGGSEHPTPTKATVAAKPSRQTAPTGGSGAKNCRLGAFLHSLDTLESGLAAGLSYEQYFEEVTTVKSAYESVPVGALELPCLTVGAPGEKALDQYIEAANVWRECRADVRCGTYTIEPRLQRKWRVASHYIALAHKGLA